MKTDNTKAMNDEMMRYVPLPDVINMTFKPNNAVKNKVAKIESTSNNVYVPVKYDFVHSPFLVL